jgi:enolase
MGKIKKVLAREVFDSRGNPTVEVEVWTDKAIGRAMVPSGASTGTHEALELRDGDKKRLGGKGVLKAVENINKVLGKLPIGMSVFDQEKVDEKLLEKDGTANKSRYGANAILGVSMAVARAAANEAFGGMGRGRGGKAGRSVTGVRGVNGEVLASGGLYRYLNPEANLLPLPMMNILNGGAHADSGLDFQEFMILPVGAETFRQAMQMGAEIFHTLGGLLKEKGFKTTVGDEGGFAPALKGQEAALDFILKAIEKAGYKTGKDIMLGTDVAASEFYDKKKKIYQVKVGGKAAQLSSGEMVDYLLNLAKKYPLISIEDGLAEDDFAGWQLLKKKSAGKLQIVGDDLFVTNVERLQMGLDQNLANSILIKLNQIGTVTETIEAVDLAEANNWTAVISHRSGETEDSFIADLSVGLCTGQIKTGSLSRTDRMAKYNQLLRIEQELGKKAIYAGFGAFYNLN